MFLRTFTGIGCWTGALLIVAGCGGPNPMPPGQAKSEPALTKSNADERADHEHSSLKNDQPIHTHSHERGKMLIADVGPYHALLTAHLSKEGNELDIFFETPVDKSPEPVAVAIKSFEAQATAGEGESQTLTFGPAPAEERPTGEKADACSHFIAKAPWMKPDDDLLVVAKFTLDGKAVVGRWKNFVPQKYAHHVE